MTTGRIDLGSGLECKLDQLPHGLACTESMNTYTMTVIGLLMMYCCKGETVEVGEEVGVATVETELVTSATRLVVAGSCARGKLYRRSDAGLSHDVNGGTVEAI